MDNPTPASSPVPTSRTSWHVSLLGGLKRNGAWRVPAEVITVAVIGGAELDLRTAVLEADSVTLTKISLVGGVDVIVPANMRVEVQSVYLIGGKNLSAPDGPADAPLLKIRAFGLFGGVKVRAA